MTEEFEKRLTMAEKKIEENTESIQELKSVQTETLKIVEEISEVKIGENGTQKTYKIGGFMELLYNRLDKLFIFLGMRDLNSTEIKAHGQFVSLLVMFFKYRKIWLGVFIFMVSSQFIKVLSGKSVLEILMEVARMIK